MLRSTGAASRPSIQAARRNEVKEAKGELRDVTHSGVTSVIRKAGNRKHYVYVPLWSFTITTKRGKEKRRNWFDLTFRKIINYYICTKQPSVPSSFSVTIQAYLDTYIEIQNLWFSITLLREITWI